MQFFLKLLYLLHNGGWLVAKGQSLFPVTIHFITIWWESGILAGWWGEIM